MHSFHEPFSHLNASLLLFYSHSATGFGLGTGSSTGGGSEALMKV